MSTFFDTNSNQGFQNSGWQSETARYAADPKEVNSLPPLLGNVPPPLPGPIVPSDTTVDVFIAGSGPVGATYARILVEAGYNVVLADVGEVDSPLRGSHKKNNVVYQKDIDKFVHVIQGALSKVSIPVNQNVVHTLNPSVWRADSSFVRNGMNPDQNPFRNLPAQAVTRVIGGMATHWTCAVPRFQRAELPLLQSKEDESYYEWWGRPGTPGSEGLYKAAENLIGWGDSQFAESIRHNLVLKTLRATVPSRTFQQIPLACKRVPDTNPYVHWSSAHTVFNFENRPDPNDPKDKQRFLLFPSTLCKRLVLKSGSQDNEIDYAEVHNFEDGKNYQIKAKVFILAAGAICNPQILVNSGFASFGPTQGPDSKIPNLGSYITEQTMTFCQTVFHKSLIDSVTADLIITGKPGEPDYKVQLKPLPHTHPSWWNDKVIAHMMEHQEDPIPIPFADPEPQVTTLFNAPGDFPWHTQIHRDAFSYGAVAETIDSRLIVDWRFFGRTQAHRENKVYYSNKYTDAFGMPQPTFDYSIASNSQTAREADRMMTDMVTMSAKVGGFLPGSEPQFMAPGLALHLGGSHRSGLNPGDSVVDVHSKVWRFSNLFLGGVGNIPTAFGSNPTLTAIGYAIKSCEYIKGKFTASPFRPQ